MKAIYETSQFRKDFKKAKKQGKQIEKLKEIVRFLAEGKPLESRYRDHALIGPLRGSSDCHIEPDWLLIYRIEGDPLFLERTGSHSDIFKKYIPTMRSPEWLWLVGIIPSRKATKIYGTATSSFRALASPEQACFPDFFR